MRKWLNPVIYYLLIGSLGATLNLAFPPHALPWLVFMTMTIFGLGLEQRGKKSSFWYGYTFYLGAVISFIGYWFSYYFRLQLGCGYVVSYTLTGIICLYTSLYIGVICALYTRLKTQNYLINLVLIFPSLWVLTELVRGLFFPRSWYALGYTQVDSLIFRGYYPLFGVYFVSWLIVAIAGLISCYILQVALNPKIWLPALGKFLVTGLIFTLVSYGLAQIKYTHKYGKTVTIALVQPNIFSSKDYNQLTLISIEEAATAQIYQNQADIFVLPETVFGTDYHFLSPGYLENLQTIMRNYNAALIFGTPIHGENDTRMTGVVKLNDLDNPVYIKHNLVPFGEYNPLKGTFLNPLLIAAVGNQLSNYIAGDKIQPPANIKGQKFVFNICYENAINDFVAKSAKYATILLNQSDLSWYGRTSMKDAFFQFSQARALENQRYFLQDGNTGDTAIINQNGEVEYKLPAFIPGTLVGKAAGYSGITPFQIVRNFPIWILCCGILITVLFFKSLYS